MNGQHNLDFLAATTAQQICEVIGTEVRDSKKVGASDVENLVTKALGVLQSQGVYAMTLFLFSRSGNDTQDNKMSTEQRVGVQILACLWPLRNPQDVSVENGKIVLDKQPLQVNIHKGAMLNELCKLTADLDTLLLVRHLYEHTLIYTRFRAKAEGK